MRTHPWWAGGEGEVHVLRELEELSLLLSDPFAGNSPLDVLLLNSVNNVAQRVLHVPCSWAL